jgi:carboxyl-terminal processing protease
MVHKGKFLIFLATFLVLLYGASAMFFGKEAYKELAVFMDVLQKIRDEYVEVPNMYNVQEGAMRGLIDSLDPYSSFLTKAQYNEIQKRQENSPAGVGIILSKRSDVIYVVSCEPEGPAAEAGVRPGDYVIAVDDIGIEEKSILEADSMLRGMPGKKVKLTIFRNSKTKPQDIVLTLANPAEIQVGSKMLEGKVGYLSIHSLSDSAVEQAKVKLKTLISAGAQKILMDLRNCADGTLENGAAVANYFLKNGVISYSQNRKGEKLQVLEASPDNFITDLPMAVLMNGSTAGAAEIVAGALKDRKRASLVGERSFGIGSSQKTLQLKSGAVLILSIAKYCTPNGKVIQDESGKKAGIAPDVISPDDDKRQDLALESYYDEQDDANYRLLQGKIEKIQIDKALEILNKAIEMAKKAA